MNAPALIWPPSGTVLGVALGEVIDTCEDGEEGLGRIKVKFKLRGTETESDWLQIVSPFACAGYGLFFLPAKGASALLAFADGNPSKPYVLGFLWNGKHKPPIEKDDQQNVRVIKTRTGKKIVFDDSEKGKIEIIDENGNVVRIKTPDKPEDNSVVIESQGNLSITAKGALTINAKEVVIGTAGNVQAKLTETGMTLSGGESMKLNANMIDLN